MNTLISTAGERYDFVLNADQPVGEYFVRVRAIGPCNFQNIEQFAVLSYSGPNITTKELSDPTRRIPLFQEIFPSGIYLNHPNTTCGQSDDFCVSDLTQNDDSIDSDLIYNEPDKTFVLAFDNYQLDKKQIFNSSRYDHFISK